MQGNNSKQYAVWKNNLEFGEGDSLKILEESI